MLGEKLVTKIHYTIVHFYICTEEKIRTQTYLKMWKRLRVSHEEKGNLFIYIFPLCTSKGKKVNVERKEL